MRCCGNCEYRRQSKLKIQFNEIPMTACCNNKNSSYYNKYIWDDEICDEWKEQTMRPIDADKLKEEVLKWMPSDPCGIEKKEFPFQKDWYEFPLMMEIEEAPTIEPKQGEWLFKEITDDYHVTGQCSICKERRRIDNFCPNCGAKMKGADDAQYNEASYRGR